MSQLSLQVFITTEIRYLTYECYMNKWGKTEMIIFEKKHESRISLGWVNLVKLG